MPTYEYKCPNGHVFERTFSRIVSQRHAKCPVCGKRAERQISGGAGIVYHTDYKRAAEKPEKPEKAEKPEKTAKAADKPADTKPSPKAKKD
jgi:putative FmdB family regulatory protein